MKKKISSFITLMCMVIALLPTNITVYAATHGKCGDNITWILDDEGTLTISGTGSMTNYNMAYVNGKPPWYDSKSSIISIVIENGVTSIGDYAFWKCTSLSAISIPSSVISIDNYAFYGCSNLIDITIPGSVTYIGKNAFYSCQSLTSVTIPDGITSIKKNAFTLCTGLTSINIPKNVTHIYDSAFQQCYELTDVTIDNGVTYIGNSAFYGCSKLKNVMIPSSVSTIGGSVFSYCPSLENIIVDENNTNYCSIDGNLFNKKQTELIKYSCGKNNSHYDIPTGVTEIGSCAFDYCAKLANVTIPNGVTKIGCDAFRRCKNLKNIIIPGSVTEIGDYALHFCESLTNITIPENVIKIDRAAFSDCTGLERIEWNAKNATCSEGIFDNAGTAGEGIDVIFSEKVDAIPEYIFYDSSNLSSSFVSPKIQSVEIGENVTSIGKCAFYKCSDLTGITMGSGITSIDDSAFSGCSSLKNVYYHSSKTEWDTISMGTYNTYLTNANRIYFKYVIIMAENGEFADEKKQPLNETLDISEFDKSGYTCRFYTDENFENEFDLSKPIANDLTLYFRYVINQYTYKFIDEDGTVLKEETVNYGTKIIPPENPTKEEAGYTYTFTGWENYNENITITEDMTFTAKYNKTVNQYTYKFVDEDGTVLKEETVDYGAEIVPPENPSKESTVQFNYTFTGWEGYTEGMTQTAEELVFYATYSVATNKYTYKFVDEDGTVLKEKTVNYNTMIIAPTSPVKDATVQYTYTFEKWDGFTLGMKITQDVTFKAVYNSTVNKYTYKFVDENGDIVDEKNVDYGTEIIAPDVILEKASTDKYTYTHTGWNGFENGMVITKDVTFTPIFDSVINKYSYKFVDEDGTVLKEDTVDFDTVITAPENPTKDATKQYTYTFIGWDGFNEGTTQKAEAMVFTAKYSEAVNKYTYKFVDDNGATLKELTVDYGTEIAPPENPSKAATDKYTYTFSKWNGYSTGMTVTDNITFTAEYSAEINKYTYKFIDHDGSVVKSGTLDYGTVIPTPVSPSGYSDQQYTYVFASWKGYVKGTKITKDIEFTARYSPIINQYTYVFADENGNTLAEETVDYGTEIIAPDAPQKPSTDKYTYVFSGWSGYTDGMTLTDDVVFTPIYTPVINKYTYKFVDDDGSVIEENTVEYGSVITAPTDPVKKATKQYTYTFIGWDGFNAGITQTAETMVFTAKYKETLNKYTYKFVDEDGTALKEETADYGTTIVAPENPTKGATAQYSYTFTGWNGYTDGMTLIDDITFTAVYYPILNKYTYKFIDKDGTTLKEDTVDYGTTVIPPETPMDKDPFTFDYWENYTDNMVVESEIVFNAIYKYKKYTITISELEKSQEVTYGDSYTLPIQEIKDFVFKGYYTEENGKGVKLTDENGKSIENYAFAESKTVYPYYVHSFTNKVMITGTDNTQPGTENVLQTVAFATDKNAKSLTCTVKYPEKFKLNVVSKDFVLANINSVETKDGYNYAYLTCMYDYAGNSIPTNQTITPFELSFAVEKDVALGEAKIEVFDIVLRGNDNYNLEETATKTITILPKLAENIKITGADIIDKATEFTAIITPDYTYSKEVVWSVDDDKIAVISKDGILTPLKNGVVTITATTTDGSNISATKQVNVTAYAKIDALSIAGVWDKEFSPDVNEYIVYVKEDVNNITVEANYTAGVLFVDNVMLLPDMENDFELKENSTILTFKRNNVADMTDSEYKIKIVKFKGTKTTVSNDGTKFTVTPINIASGSTVILALYNGDTFVEMQSKPYIGEDIPFTTDKAYTNAKVMVWNNLESMTPICEAEIIGIAK